MVLGDEEMDFWCNKCDEPVLSLDSVTLSELLRAATEHNARKHRALNFLDDRC